MKVPERLNKFLKFVGENLENDIDYEEDEIEEQQEQEKPQKQEEQETQEEPEKKTKKEKIADTTKTLLEKLESLQKQLENEKLTPWQRFIYQIKLAMVESRLDKRIAYLNIEDFKENCQKEKENIKEDYNQKLEETNYELETIFDQQYELERDIEILAKNIKERKTTYADLNHNIKSSNTYQYKMSPKVKTDLEKKQEELEKLIDQKEAKQEEIKKMQQELLEKQKNVDKMKKNKLIKYNSFAINWNMIKSFFSRAKNNVVEWYQTSKLEKEVSKQAVKEAKVKAKQESKEKVRKKVAEIKSKENETKVNQIREEIGSRIHLEESEESQELEEQIETEQDIQEKKENQIQEANKYFERVKEAKQLYQERASKSERPYEYEKNNYVPVEQDNEEEKRKPTKREQFLQENAINPILKWYMEESQREGFDEQEFTAKLGSPENSYTIEQLEEGLKEIEQYKQEQASIQKASNDILKMYLEEKQQENFDQHEFIGKIRNSKEFTKEQQQMGMRAIDNYIKEQKMAEEEIDR